MVGRGAGGLTIPTQTWTPLYPPGPYPPHGEERNGTVDFGVRLRESLFVSSLFTGPVRRVLLDAIRRAGRHPDRVAMAGDHVDAFIDTWALGAMIDAARVAWTAGPDGDALAVLTRGVEVLGPVLGWPRTVDRRWPLPDEDWMRQQVIDGVQYAVVPRGPRDGAHAVSVALGLPMAPPEPVNLPKTVCVPGDEIAARVQSLLAIDGLAAVEFEGYAPFDEATLAARELLRDRLPAQSGLDTHGLAGLAAREVPHFSELLGDAAPGEMGDRFRRLADGLILPTVDSDRTVGDVGWLVWSGPIRPARVHPAAVEVLLGLDKHSTVDGLCEALDVPEALVAEVLRQLVDLGATTRLD